MFTLLSQKLNLTKAINLGTYLKWKAAELKLHYVIITPPLHLKWLGKQINVHQRSRHIFFLENYLSTCINNSPIISVSSVWFWLVVLHHFEMLVAACQCTSCCFACTMETDVANHVTCVYAANQNRVIMTSSASLFKVRLPRI